LKQITQKYIPYIYST